ncbi:Pectinacetylesterase [Seminavis robusta]|uniref:Pectinacetylesterase n=1 Tax=Seminavis robusta TaxID=568900 RepID=A0A9N8EFN2_9STRA|nr:Pectinacetylesterase [Seminavis robusta]|eukprot:Sro1117_g242950.1 Pectinacetylesterase (483) ;mRNA; r:3213-4661
MLVLYIQSLALHVVIVLVVATELASSQQDECRIDFASGQTCRFDGLSNGVSTLIYPDPSSGARCFTDTRRDGTPQEYFFQVIPGDVSNLLLWFQGGSACFSTETCIDGGLTVQDIFPLNLTLFSNGVLDTTDPRNPFAGWTLVYLPYCSGDSFMGNKVTEDGLVHFKGNKNARAVLDWLFANFGDGADNVDNRPLERAIFGGLSSGALALAYWSNLLLQWINSGFTQQVQKPITTVLFDSNVFFFKEYLSDRVLEIWDVCQPNIGFNQTILELCKQGDFFGLEAVLLVTKTYTDVPFAFILGKGDLVLLGGWCVSGLEGIDVAAGSIDLANFGLADVFTVLLYLAQSDPAQVADALYCTPSRFYKKVQERLLILHENVNEENNVLSYFINTPDHAFLPFEAFYTTSASDGCTFPTVSSDSPPSLVDWVSSLVYRVEGARLSSECVKGVGLWPWDDFGCNKEVTHQFHIAKGDDSVTIPPNPP